MTASGLALIIAVWIKERCDAAASKRAVIVKDKTSVNKSKKCNASKNRTGKDSHVKSVPSVSTASSCDDGLCVDCAFDH